jgi:hypothetical protein
MLVGLREGDEAVPIETLHAPYAAALELVHTLIAVVPNCDPSLVGGAVIGDKVVHSR